MTTEHDKLVEDCARAMVEDLAIREDHWQRWDDLEEADHEFAKQQARAAIAVAVERCAAEAREIARSYARSRDGWHAALNIEAAIRALLSPNDRGQA